MTTIGERIKAARKAKQPPLTQAELARLAGVSQSTIGNLEAGSRDRPRDLLGIASALGVSSHWLATGKGTSEHGAPPPMEWPFELFSREQWQSLSERQRGAVEAAALAALQNLHASAATPALKSLRSRRTDVPKK